jgi:2-polyprenyl-3-methyl-5-hydroxy-6-metoxy-1,4-benzoquinol methylase
MNHQYYQNHREDIQKHITKCNSILEVGCAKGLMGKNIKEKYPNLIYYGIDFHKPSLEIAKCFLDFTYHFDFNKDDINFFDKHFTDCKFDFIIFADVLEHLIDPIGTIKYFKQYLNDNGSIIISIPNICHISVIKELLLNRDFPYAEQGILDKTHLKFYTKNSFIREINPLVFTKVEYFYQNGFKSKILSLFFGDWILNYFTRQIIYKAS